MSRFEKKCFIGSAGFHGLLLVVFVFGAAFLPSKRRDSTIGVITFIPSSDLQNAGTPGGSPAPPAPAPAQPDPPAPQPVQPKPVEPELVKPLEEVVKPKDKPEIANDSEKGPLPKIKPEPKQVAKDKTPPKPAISTKVIKRTPDLAKLNQAKADQAKAEAAYRAKVEAYNAQRSKIASDVSGALAGVGKSLSRSTVVTSIGTDTSGGAVSGRYGDGLKAMYDRNWVLNNDLYDDDTVASVSVVVRRDGTVKSAIMTKSSGNAAFDRSVRAALNAVQRVQPFPAEMKDAEREFTWKFERKTRIG